MYFTFEFLGTCVGENTHATFDNIVSKSILKLLHSLTNLKSTVKVKPYPKYNW